MGKKTGNDDPKLRLACARVEIDSGDTGTAYLVSETWAVTCKHLVDTVGKSGEVQLYFPTAPEETVLEEAAPRKPPGTS